MIKGKIKQSLNSDTILSKISQYDIYHYYTPCKFKINKSFSSPLRIDKDPSFCIRIDRNTGEPYHIDFVVKEHRGNCFDYVKQMFNITFSEALLKIDYDFGLGIVSDSKVDYKAIVGKYEQPKEVSQPAIIHVVTRNFTKEELAYWNQYHIDISELKKFNVYAIDKLFLNGRRVSNYDNDMKFAYHYEPKWKIYTPYAKDKKNKWFPNNVPNGTMEGLENLKGCDKAVITKSKKDLMTLSKFYPCVASTQNESAVAINNENMEFIQQNTKDVYIAFDSDEAGKRNSWFYTTNYGFKHINVPDHFVGEGIKDFADLSKDYGIEKVIEHFKIKGLI